jgi:hypothetical protein
MKRRHTSRITEARRPARESRRRTSSTLERKKPIMQVRHLFAAALLAATAVSAMSQEIDRRDQQQSFTSTRTSESVKAEVRNLQAQGALKTVGEKADAPVVATVPNRYASGVTRAEVKADLAAWRATHAVRVGELG